MNSYEQYNQYIKEKTTTNLDVVSTGYGNLDKYLGYKGMQPDFCFVIIGSPGSGKTYYIVNLALKTIEKERKVLFFSLEMSYHAIMDRIHQVIFGVHFSEIQDYVRDNESEVVRTLKNMGFFDRLLVYDRTYTIEDIDEIIKEEKPDVIYIDHLHLIQSNFTDIYKQTTFLMNGLFRLKKKYQTRIVVLLHSRRDSELKHPGAYIPYLQDGKGSGSIEANCDYAIGLGRPDADPNVEMGLKNIIRAIPRKCRFPSIATWQAEEWRYDRKTGRLIEKI